MVETSFIKPLLLLLIVILGFLNIVLFSTISINHFWKSSIYKRKKELKEKYSEIMIDGIFNNEIDSKKIKLSRKIEYETFIEICIDLIVSFPDKMFLIHKAIFETNTYQYLRKNTYSKEWDKKFYAIEKLGYLKLDALKEILIELYSSEELLELKINILIAMSMIADIKIARFITYALSKDVYLSPKLIEFLYVNIFKNMIKRKDIENENVIIKDIKGKYILETHIKEKTNDIDSFIYFFNKIREDDNITKLIKISIIDAIGVAKLEEAENSIVDYYYYYQDDIDIRSACIRAFGEFKSKNTDHLIIKAMDDKDWILRNTSAKVSVKIGKSILPNLNKLLYDKSYNVRLNSAKSLSMIGQEGLNVLAKELKSEDKFVRETAQFILDLKGKASYV
ncbi:MAG: HEAT repeat domain-containing protein [Candidatus Sericytochromatia bacterium]